MKYGIYSLLEYNDDNKHEDLSAQLLKCKTIRELKEALTPHVKRIIKKYEDCCYGTITATIDSFKNEIYELERTVSVISIFNIDALDNVVKDILDH